MEDEKLKRALDGAVEYHANIKAKQDKIEAVMAAQREFSEINCNAFSNMGQADYEYAQFVIDYRPVLREALSFYSKYLQLADSHRMVPVECSQVMHIAGHDAQLIAEAEHPEHGTVIAAIWDAMLSACPDPFGTAKLSETNDSSGVK